ncbi:hypothetical protein M8J75_016272 [Diaphorina citri]|nr:hypothetical protein M8J75_016272 [Diaphorina citri]KAI5746577.1 hypothetical protein M8J77_005094 [Diaphorina citri]
MSISLKSPIDLIICPDLSDDDKIARYCDTPHEGKGKCQFRAKCSKNYNNIVQTNLTTSEANLAEYKVEAKEKKEERKEKEEEEEKKKKEEEEEEEEKKERVEAKKEEKEKKEETEIRNYVRGVTC